MAVPLHQGQIRQSLPGGPKRLGLMFNLKNLSEEQKTLRRRLIEVTYRKNFPPGLMLKRVWIS